MKNQRVRARRDIYTITPVITVPAVLPHSYQATAFINNLDTFGTAQNSVLPTSLRLIDMPSAILEVEAAITVQELPCINKIKLTAKTAGEV